MSIRTESVATGAGRRRSLAARINVIGLVLTAAAMLLQMAAGSTLYPSLAGPVVLLATAGAVLFVPNRWTAILGLIVPLVLGIGAIAAAAMTGTFIDQLSDLAAPVLVLGSVLHIVGLAAAACGGVAMVVGRDGTGDRGR